MRWKASLVPPPCSDLSSFVLFCSLLLLWASLKPNLPCSPCLGSFEAKQNLRVGVNVCAHEGLRSLPGKTALQKETAHHVAWGQPGSSEGGSCKDILVSPPPLTHTSHPNIPHQASQGPESSVEKKDWKHLFYHIFEALNIQSKPQIGKMHPNNVEDGVKEAGLLLNGTRKRGFGGFQAEVC